MFGWLQIRKSQPTALVTAATREGKAGLASRLPVAAGLEALPFDTETLKPHPILALLPAGALERLVAESAIAEYPKGTVIFHEDEPCDAIFLIISGRCETRIHGLNGSSRVEEVFGPGDTLGERAFLNREPHR